LKPESFAQLRKVVFDKLKNSNELIEALLVFTVLNDLGKVGTIINNVRTITKTDELDHDKILYTALKISPSLFPSYQRLSLALQDKLVKGLEAQFNFAQLVQGENVPGSLAGLKCLENEDPLTVDLFNLHALFDIAGAAGHLNAFGSVTLQEDTFHDVELCFTAVETAIRGASLEDVYNHYLAARGKSLHLDPSKPSERAVLRLVCMSRFHDAKEAEPLVEACKKLGYEQPEIWVYLRDELNFSGTIEGVEPTILIYYGPALLTNVLKAVKQSKGNLVEGFVTALKAMNECFDMVRQAVKRRRKQKVVTVNIGSIALKGTTPEKLFESEFVLTPVGEDFMIAPK